MNTLEAFHFWAWFGENHAAFRQINLLDDEGKESLFEKLHFRLHKYCKGLDAEFMRLDADEKILIITANGYEQYFKAAEDLVLMAPKLSGWIMLALEPAVWEYPIIFDWKGKEVRSDGVWFSVFDNEDQPNKLDIAVYFKEFDEANQDWYYEAAEKMLQTMLGERSCALDIACMCVEALPEEPNGAGILVLEDLTSYIEFWKSQILLN